MRQRHLACWPWRTSGAYRPALAFVQSVLPALRRHVELNFGKRIQPLVKMSLSQLPRVIVITGPTSVGKSANALELAKRINGEIVSADSVQLYKYLNIGSNKATPTEQRLVPHHLLDIADPLNEFTAGDFYRRARAVTSEIAGRGKIPIVVGGTMMYVRWFIHGRPATPPAADTARQRVEAAVRACNGDWEAGVALLAARDPKRVEMLMRNDWYRLTRALEVFETTGVPMTEMPLIGGAPNAMGSHLDYDFRCVFLVGERVPMNRRIDRRCESMILSTPLVQETDNPDGRTNGVEKSILVEVSSLLVSKRLRVAPASPCLAIGYRQTISYLVSRALSHADGLKNEEEGHATKAFRSYVEDFQQATRTYAKQQIAWFRKDPMFRWVNAGSDAIDEIESISHLSEVNYKKLCKESIGAQSGMKDDMIAQGKLMKTYIAEQSLLSKDSEFEKRAVSIGESCAQQITSAIEQAELERMMAVVSRK